MTIKRTNFYQAGFYAVLNLCLIVFIFLSYAPASAKISSPILPSYEHTKQCKKIIKALELYHYLEKELDNPLSSTILERYIKRLDPGKQLFTSRDVNRFRTRQFKLDNELKRGDLSTGFKMFGIYMERSRQRLEYILSLLKNWENEFVFTKNDSILLDNDIRQWKTDSKALQMLWRNSLKNHIITLRLENKKNGDITDTLNKVYGNRLKRLMQTDANDVFQYYMNSVTSSFDPHTQFLPPRVFEEFDIDMSKSLEGIGAVLQNEYEYTKVVRLIPKGPADKSNLLMPGDKIIGVGQGKRGEIKDTIGQRIDRVVKLIRGPKNSIVRLKIIPAKKNDITRTIQIRRDRVKLEEQSAQKTVVEFDRRGRTYKIGIIEIPNFYIDFAAYRRGDKDYKSTTRDVRKLISELKKEGIEGLIVDLRDNGGGSLEEANQLTGLFLRSGPTVQVKDKSRVKRYYDNDPRIEYSGPLVVLINRMSASASEIFAGAIKDYNRGVIVGTRSFGKATVQELLNLGKGKLKLTSAKFYRVSGESTQNIGIEPDLKYPQLYDIEDTGESSLEGTLPRDTTNKTSYNAYRPLHSILEKLNDAYRNRSMHDPGLAYLKNRIRMASQLDSQTSLSLNLEARKSRRDHFEQLELDIENDYLTSMGKTPKKKTDQETETSIDYKKILMDQTQLVMADFIEFSNNMGYTW